ncbi:unnamed protein product [Chondrus crispus]|uniref:Uncharacterized protein n=1 Tax=Chondrus crispus TaxID=2769 RepID=R7Q4Q5_CHOCR|nr:unnamed protein product [Chondrus crispus]CDF32440.1 unnamed protein product [Chondrus crispus]|eukprot:XP_005712105.1 unnamed protein product [Chondrus crispus]
MRATYGGRPGYFRLQELSDVSATYLARILSGGVISSTNVTLEPVSTGELVALTYVSTRTLVIFAAVSTLCLSLLMTYYALKFAVTRSSSPNEGILRQKEGLSGSSMWPGGKNNHLLRSFFSLEIGDDFDYAIRKVFDDFRNTGKCQNPEDACVRLSLDYENRNIRHVGMHGWDSSLSPDPIKDGNVLMGRMLEVSEGLDVVPFSTTSLTDDRESEGFIFVEQSYRNLPLGPFIAKARHYARQRANLRASLRREFTAEVSHGATFDLRLFEVMSVKVKVLDPQVRLPKWWTSGRSHTRHSAKTSRSLSSETMRMTLSCQDMCANMLSKNVWYIFTT